jgi:hypothetical protein
MAASRAVHEPAMPDFPVPRFDQFYRHPELTRLLDYTTAICG